MNVISLAPNITQIITYIGAEEKLVGHTAFTSVDSSKEVGGWLNPNYDTIEDLNPDIIFTSDLLQREVKRDLENQYNIHHSEPSSVQELIPLIETVGELIDEDVSEDCDKLQSRIDTVKQYVESEADTKPVVYCEEWNDPPMVAGNWVPDVVDIAGGSYPFLDTGTRSKKISKDQFESEQPDYFISHVCGSGMNVDCSSIEDRGWDTPEEVYIFHDDLLNQLSPRLVDGVEYICNILHGYPVDSTESVSEC